MKKLILTRETIRALQDSDLKQVVGGANGHADWPTRCCASQSHPICYVPPSVAVCADGTPAGPAIPDPPQR